MKIKFLSFLVLSIFIFSCVNNESGKKVKNKRYGGGLVVETHLSFKDRFSSSQLIPYQIGETSYGQIYRSFFETLTYINPNTSDLSAGLAKSWSVNDNATEFTFTLRKNVFFHGINDRNKALTANDVKISFDELSLSKNKSVAYAKIKDLIQGVLSYNNSVNNEVPLKEGVSGVVVLNDSTILFKLTKPYTPFPEVVSNVDFSIFRKCGTNNCLVGTGPFVFDTIIENTMRLVRNSNYWKFDEQNNRLPYLDILSFKKKTMSIEERLTSFISNETHIMTGIRTDDINTVMRVLREENDVNFGYQSIGNSRLTALSFNTLLPPFNDANVRRAFNYAFNRNLFVDSVLNGEQWAANNSLVPSGISQYKSEPNGIEYNLTKAKEYLAKAGYPNGRNFPLVELSVVSSSHSYGSRVSKIERTVMDMICANLGITYKLKEYNTFYKMFQDLWRGKGMISIYNYTSMYTSPESYLNVYHLKIDTSENVEHDNTMFFRDSVFDMYYIKALKEINKTKRNNFFYKAENRVLELAPVLPIFHGEANRIISDKIVGLSEINNLGIVNYSKVYFLN